MVSILFRGRTLQRYSERMQNIDINRIKDVDINSLNKNEYVENEKLEKEIKLHGVWYYDGMSEKGCKYYICVVSNLKVYLAHEEQDIIFVDTIYPFQKSLRSKLVKLERANPLS